MSALFTREGAEYTGKFETSKRGAYYQRRAKCSRCGGAGGSSKWDHTGWVCFDCQGSGFRGVETIRLYTADKLVKLNAAADKRQAKRDAEYAAKVAADKVQADANRAAFLAQHAELLANAAKWAEGDEDHPDGDEFLADLIRTGTERAFLSEKQIAAMQAAIGRHVQRAAERAQSRYVGLAGDRIEACVTVTQVASYSRPMYGMADRLETVNIITMADKDGALYVSKSPNFFAEKGETFKMRATIKEHSEYNGAKQNVVQRVKVVEA